ncbi:MAG: rRNA maturation RNase YbeY [Flavobacteriaceae bacterium]
MHRIDFFYETDFLLNEEPGYRTWVRDIIVSEKRSPGAITFIFCDDDYLLELHQKYLNKNDYTDIISFDYSEGDVISGDIFISIPRLKENAASFGCRFEDELIRVMCHGILHLVGYKDKTPGEIEKMREKENEKMKMFHVEH